eukprot:m.157066 g.157066  ORF g.157066 m.157066 type:complete len:220 (-) comp17960_c0_seq1:488-1147(-)
MKARSAGDGDATISWATYNCVHQHSNRDMAQSTMQHSDRGAQSTVQRFGYILKRHTYGTKLPYLPERDEAAVWISSLLENVARTPLMRPEIEAKLYPEHASDGLTVDLAQTSVIAKQDPSNAAFFCLEWSWLITHIGGTRVTQETVSRHSPASCVNDSYLKEAVNIIQAKAQTVHEALHTAKEQQRISEQFRTVHVSPPATLDSLGEGSDVQRAESVIL